MSLSVVPIPPPYGSSLYRSRSLAYASRYGVSAPPAEAPEGATRDSNDVSGLPGLQSARRKAEFLSLPDKPYGIDQRPPGEGVRNRWRDSSGQSYEQDPFPKRVPHQSASIVASSFARRTEYLLAVEPRFGWLMYLVPFVAAGAHPSASACVSCHEMLVQAEHLAKLYGDHAGALTMKELYSSAPWPRLARARKHAAEAVANAERLARIAARAAAARKGRPISEKEADAVNAGALVPAEALARADRLGWSRAFGVDASVLGAPSPRLPLTAGAKEVQEEARNDCARVVLLPEKEKIQGMVRAMRRALAQHWVAREDAARTALAEQARAIARAKAQAKAEAKADGKGKKKGRGRGRKKQTAVPGAGQPGSVFASGTAGVGPDGLPGVSMGAGGLPSDQVSSVSAEQFRMSVAERASLEPVRDTTAEERESGRQLLIVDGTGALDAALLDWMQKVPPVPVPPSDGALEGCPIVAGYDWLRQAHEKCSELLWRACNLGASSLHASLEAAGLLPSQLQLELYDEYGETPSKAAGAPPPASPASAPSSAAAKAQSSKKHRRPVVGAAAFKEGLGARAGVFDAIQSEIETARRLLVARGELHAVPHSHYGVPRGAAELLAYAAGYSTDGKKGRPGEFGGMDESEVVAPRLPVDAGDDLLEADAAGPEDADRRLLCSTSASSSASAIGFAGVDGDGGGLGISPAEARELLASGALLSGASAIGLKRGRESGPLAGATEAELAAIRGVLVDLAAMDASGLGYLPVVVQGEPLIEACRRLGVDEATVASLRNAFVHGRGRESTEAEQPASKRARSVAAAGGASSAGGSPDGLAAIQAVTSAAAAMYGDHYCVTQRPAQPETQASSGSGAGASTAAASRPTRKAAKSNRRAGSQPKPVTAEEAQEAGTRALAAGGEALLAAAAELAGTRSLFG